MLMLETILCGMRLSTPVMSASGILDEHGASMLRLLKSGASAVTTKSIGENPREGNPNPTIVEVDGGLINGMGLPNPGMDLFRDEINEIKTAEPKAVIIGSIFGNSSESFSILAKKMENCGVNALELNLSCPHAKGFGAEIGGDSDNVVEITREVKKSVKCPVLVKITPNVASVVDLAKACEEGGADGIVAINTVRAMKIDIRAGIPALSSVIGGLSGPAIRPIGVRCVYEIFEEISLPIVGVGGILNGRDAVEYMMAGARAVQIGSAVYYREIDVFREINDEIEHFLREEGLDPVEIIGMCHRR